MYVEVAVRRRLRIGAKIFSAVIAALVLIMLVAALVLAGEHGYPQATGIFPQVVSCVQENPPRPHSDKQWQPTLRVTVEPVRRSEGGGRIREYEVLGCTLYYYHGHFR